MNTELTSVKILVHQDIWIDIKTLANLKGFKERSIRLNLSKYITRKINGSYDILGSAARGA